MGDRRKSRELAVQILYEIELKGVEPKTIFDNCPCTRDEEEVNSFVRDLVEGVYRNRNEIDAVIEKHSLHWKLARMAVVDRNILRLAAYELLYLHDVPTNAILNEAIEIAKKFGTEDSGAFINGILDKVAHNRRESPRDGAKQ